MCAGYIRYINMDGIINANLYSSKWEILMVYIEFWCHRKQNIGLQSILRAKKKKKLDRNHQHRCQSPFDEFYFLFFVHLFERLAVRKKNQTMRMLALLLSSLFCIIYAGEQNRVFVQHKCWPDCASHFVLIIKAWNQ